MNQNQNQWVTLITTYGMFDAQIIAGRLEAESIPVRILPMEAGHRLGLTVGKLGEVAVQTPESFLETAEAILETDYSDDEDFHEDFVEDGEAFDDEDEL